MNIEEQCLDLCNVKTKSNVDVDSNTTNNTEVTPRISELMTDGNTEKQNIVPVEASETYLRPQLTDNLQATEEDTHLVQNTLEIDAVNGNGKSSGQDSLVVVNPPDLIFSNDEQHRDNIPVEKIKDDAVEEGDDGADMDIGVDLSLDESGVLEAESSNVHRSTDDTLNSDSTSQVGPAASAAASLSDTSQASGTEDSSIDQAGLYPLVEEGDDKHKASGKRVTFPSDEDIVSGAVEPKDPWRHGNTVCLSLQVCMWKITFSMLLFYCACMNMSDQSGLFSKDV